MRALALSLALTIAGVAASARAADYGPPGTGLFTKSEESVVTLTPGAWFTSGFARTSTETADSGRAKQNANLMATADVELLVPGSHWLGIWGRGAQTVANRKADSGDTQDLDSDFTSAEVNAVLSLVGRGSPLFESEDLPHSHLDLYLGARYFREKYNSTILGVERDVDGSWFGPQVGLRGEWYLQDTYDIDALRGWSLFLRGAVMPWMKMESTDRRDDVKAFELESKQAYGGDAAAGVSWRKGPVTLGLGFEALWLRTDGGDETDATDIRRDILEARSTRYGPFLTLSISF